MKQLSLAQKRSDFDLIIIMAVTMAVLAVFISFQSFFNELTANEDVHILIRTAVMAFMQFGVAGLGSCLVMIYRREDFRTFGLRRSGAGKAVVLTTLLCILCAVLFYFANGISSYLPFQQVGMTRKVLASPFPTNIIGYLIIAVSWGFFEGFNYVVIADKINIRYPSRYRWLNRGALTCAIACILIHGMVGVTAKNLLEMAAVTILIYGMLYIREHTGNAWGCVLVFIFFWNAF